MGCFCLHIRSIVVLASLLCCQVSCGQDEEAAIRSTHDKFNAASSANDFQTVVSLVNQNTLDFFERMRTHAINSGPETISSLPMVDRMFIATIRAHVEPSYLKQLSSAQLVMVGMRDGWLNTTKDGKSPPALGEILVDADRAEAEIIANGQTGPFKFVFTKEDGLWKHDMAALLKWASETFEQSMKRHPNPMFSEDEQLLQVLSAQHKKQITSVIWNKPK
jgi:hypothetical protein